MPLQIGIALEPCQVIPTKGHWLIKGHFSCVLDFHEVSFTGLQPNEVVGSLDISAVVNRCSRVFLMNKLCLPQRSDHILEHLLSPAANQKTHVIKTMLCSFVEGKKIPDAVQWNIELVSNFRC